jgi:hypothetical protein
MKKLERMNLRMCGKCHGPLEIVKEGEWKGYFRCKDGFHTSVLGVSLAPDLSHFPLRPPEMKHAQFCPVCGTQDLEWETTLRKGSSVTLARLKKNQCVAYGTGHNDHTLYTHRCKGIRHEEQQ